MSDDEDLSEASGSRSASREIDRAIGNHFVKNGDVMAAAKPYHVSLTPASELLKTAGLATELRKLQESLAPPGSSIAAVQGTAQLREIMIDRMKEFEAVRRQFQQTGKQWSEIVESVKEATSNIGPLNKSFLAELQMPQLSAIMESLRELGGTISLKNNALPRLQLHDIMQKSSSDLRRMYAELNSAGRHLTDALNEFRKVHIDWSSFPNKSFTSALAASMLAAAPSGQFSRSVLELSALSTAAMDIQPQDGVWDEIRRTSLLIDNLAALHVAETAHASGNVGRDVNLDVVEERTIAAITAATNPSQRLAYIQTIIAILALLVAVIPIYQASLYHEQDAAAAKGDPAVLDQLAKQAEILTRIASQLQEENSEVAMVVVRRSAILRQGPSTSSPKIRTLMSGDMAVLLGTADGWTRVEVADPLTNKAIVGWVYSKLVSHVYQSWAVRRELQ